MTVIVFDYSTWVRAVDFKLNVSKFTGAVAIGFKHGMKAVVKACAMGYVPILTKVDEPSDGSSTKI